MCWGEFWEYSNEIRDICTCIWRQSEMRGKDNYNIPLCGSGKERVAENLWSLQEDGLDRMVLSSC